MKLNEKPFRIQQIKDWVYKKGIERFADMHGIPSSLSQSLEKAYQFGSLELDTERVSKDGTIKRVYRLVDGTFILLSTYWMLILVSL